MADENKTQDKDILDNKNITVLSYVWILCLVPLLGKRNSKFAQFHAKQGLVLFGIEILASFFFWFQPFHSMVMLVFFVISVLGIVKVLNGEWWKIPYIYDWSKKFNI